jgi:predicted nucleotidyltransferase/DNA-binding transcriptional ArsR family regulator
MKKKKDLNRKKDYKPYMANISQNWLNILIPFSHDYTKRISGSEISRIVKIPQRSVSRYLSQIIEKNILKFEVKGKNKFYYLDLEENKTYVLINLIESYKSFVFSLNSNLWIKINPLLEFGTVVLFGSYVKGYSTELSDIDLVVFSKKSEKLKKVLRKLPNVQAHIITFDDFSKLILKKDALSIEILKNHVVFGDIQKFTEICWRYYG